MTRFCPRRPKRLTAMLAFAVALAVPSAASAEPYFGFNDGSFWKETTPAQSAALHADAGATSTRVTLDWSYIEGTPGNYGWKTYDAIYHAQLARGIRPLFTISGAPAWAWEPGRQCAAGDVCRFPPARAHDGAWATFAERVAARYPQLAGIEVWNEPNFGGFWRGGIDPARYTELLELAYDAIKRVRPGMTVVAGGMAGILQEPGNSYAMSTRQFLQAMYENGARGHMDAIALHPYPEDVDFWRTYKLISAVKDTAAAHGDDLPLWLTEVGITTTDGRFNEAAQGAIVSNLWERLRDYRALPPSTSTRSSRPPTGARPTRRAAGASSART